MKKKYLSQTNEFVCSGNNNLRQHMDWFIEGKIFSPSLSLSLWYQSQRNYGSKQSIDCELRVNQYCVKKTRKKKKKGIICLLWCEGLRVAVWIQGNGLIIPFELIAKTGNFFFNVDYVFLFLFFNHVFSVSEKVFFLIFYHVIIFFPQCLKRFRHGLWKRVSAGSVSSFAVT